MQETNSVICADLSAAFNGKGITWKRLGIEGRLDLQGLHIHGELVPNGETITAAGTAFAFPRTDVPGGCDHIYCEGQRLELNAGRCAEAAFLGFCTWGNFKGPLTVHYADGTEERKELALSDWIQPQKSKAGFFDDEIAFTFPYVHSDDVKMDLVHGFLVHKVALDGTRELASITLPDNPNMYVFALTLTGR